MSQLHLCMCPGILNCVSMLISIKTNDIKNKIFEIVNEKITQ